MTDTLQAGMTFEFSYPVPENRTVPHLFPDIEEGAVMPKVLATGYMVGLMEFACIKFINPHIDWPRQQTVGIHINVSHTAATPPGMTVVIKGKLEVNDIPVLLEYESLGPVMGLTVDGLGQVRVLVPEDKAEMARALLEEAEDDDDSSGE